MTGPFAGRVVDEEIVSRAGISPTMTINRTTPITYTGETLIMELEDYDDAVKIEIAVLDGLRVKGLF